jgi:hypothetical protein
METCSDASAYPSPGALVRDPGQRADLVRWRTGARALRRTGPDPLLRDHVPIDIFDTHIFVHYVAGRLVPPKVRACVDFLVERFRAEPDWDRAAAESAA